MAHHYIGNVAQGGSKGEEETGAPPPEAGIWQRFLDQKTAPQRLLVALAAVVTSVAIVAGGVYTVLRLGDDSDPASSTTSSTTGSTAPTATRLGTSSSTRPGSTVVRQQSPEADRFVHDLVEAASGPGTIRLNHIVYEQGGRVIFTDSDMRLVYNCIPQRGCDTVRLQFPNGLENRARVVEDGTAAEYLGQYNVMLTRGVEFGDDALDIAFVWLGA